MNSLDLHCSVQSGRGICKTRDANVDACCDARIGAKWVSAEATHFSQRSSRLSTETEVAGKLKRGFQ